jgi:hypothetical protein
MYAYFGDYGMQWKRLAGELTQIQGRSDSGHLALKTYLYESSFENFQNI